MNSHFKIAIFALASTVAGIGAAGEATKETAADVAKAAAAQRELSSFPVRMPSTIPNRSIYLNGVDISSARNQDLRNVQVKVGDNGDIYISAPQYQVTEEETFMPLSSYSGRSGTPTHRPPQELNGPNSPKTAKVVPEAEAALPAASAAPATPAVPAAPASPTPPKSGG